MRRRTTKSLGASWLSSMLVASTIVAAATMGGIVLAVGPTTAAGADPIGNCTTTVGEIVAVDFSPWGGDVVRGCDATLTTGYAALQEAGFTTAGDEHDGPAFICRIDDFPTAAQDPCVNTPPATAYWSYWHADAGQNTWTYSTEGAMTYQPPAGSVDAWVYGSTVLGGTDGEPSFSPSAVRANNTSVATTSPGPSPTTAATSPPPAGSYTPSQSSSPAKNSTAPKGGAVVVPESHSGGSSPTSPGSTINPTSTTPSTATFRWPTTTTTTTINWGALSAAAAASKHSESTPKIVDAAPAASDHPSSGSPAPLIEGVAVVVALTAVAYLVAWRRRRAG